MEENSKEKEKREKATPKHNLYNFTLSLYFLSHEVKAKSKIVQIV